MIRFFNCGRFIQFPAECGHGQTPEDPWNNTEARNGVRQSQDDISDFLMWEANEDVAAQVLPSLFCSEKYLRNLLQIEAMLKIWFPQVAFQSDARNQAGIPRLPSQWHRNQLHMPVKVNVCPKQQLISSNETFILQSI